MFQHSFIAFLAASLLAPASAVTGADTVDSILAKHFDAQGGLARLKSARTVTYTVRGEGEKAFTKTIQMQRPDLMRVDGEKDGKAFSKAFNGKAGWVLEGGAVKMVEGKELASMKQWSEFDDALIDHKRRGHRVDLVGTADVAGVPAHELKLTLATGEVQRRFLDKKSFLEVKRISSGTHEGKAYEKTVFLSDYRKVDGIMVNHAMEYEMDGKRTRSVVEKVRFDVPIDVALFAVPKATGTKVVKAEAH